MENKNTVIGNDWVATMLSNPNQTVDSLIDSGINSQNTQLASKDDYRDTKKIQQMFTDQNGKFSESDFDKFYDQAQHSYNAMSMKTFNDDAVVQRSYFENQMGAPKEAPKRSLSGTFEKVANPMKNIIGMKGLSEVSPSQMSVREIAQQNFVRDSKTGQSLGWKPNDDNRSGIFDFLFKTEPVVLAQWDEKGTHKDPFTGKIVTHEKGEQKLDENGDFYYETLGNRESQDKTFLTMSDTLTNDGSFANKFDFMDSDGLDKSITGTIMKTAASIVPYFIPYVKYAYTALNTANEAADAFPSLIKGLAGLTGSDLSKNETLNSIQGYARRMKSGSSVSDYSKQRAFSFENMMGIVSSTVDQLYSQKMVAQIPALLGSKTSQIAKYTDELNKLSTLEEGKTFAQLSEAAQSDLISKYAKTSKIIDQLNKSQEFWSGKAALNLSTLYMAATSSTQAYEDAKRQGLDQQDASVYYTGVLAGMFGLTKYTELGHWALKGIGIDDAGKALNKVVKEEGEGFISAAAKANNAYIEQLGKTESKKSGNYMLNLFNAGLDTSKSALKKFVSGDISTYLEAATAEGIEEVSEELMQDTLKNAYNGLNKLGWTKTEKGNEFQFTADDILTRYATSFIGGAVGGAIFKGSDALMNKMTGHIPPEVNKDLMWHVANGNAEKALNIVQEQEDKGLYGSTTLTPNAVYSNNFNFDQPDFTPTTDKSKSQNAYIANLLRAKIQQLKAVVDQYEIPSQLALGQDYTDKVQKLIDIKLNSSMSDDVDKLSSDIYENVSKLRSIEKPNAESTEEEVKAYKKSIKTYEDKIKNSREELQAISNGDRLQKYFEEAFFATRTPLSNTFDVKTPNDFAKAKYQQNYVELTDDQKQDVDDLYNSYSTYSKRDQIKLSKDHFDVYKKFVLDNRDKFIERAKEKGLNIDLGTLKEYTDVFESIKDKNIPFLDLVKKYNESVEFDMNPADLPYIPNNDLLNKEIDDEFKKENLEAIKNIPYIRSITQTYLLQKYQGDTKIMSDEEAESMKSVLSVSDFVPRDEMNAFNANFNKDNMKLINFDQQTLNQWKTDGLNDTIAQNLQNILNKKESIIKYVDNIGKKLTVEEESPSTLLGVAKDLAITTAEKDENDNIFTIFDVLEKENKKFKNPTFNLGEYVINSKLTEDQIDKSIDVLDKLQMTIFQMSKLKGYGNETFITAVNDVLDKNGVESEYKDKEFSQEELVKINNEIGYYKAQLGFMKEVSQQNKGNKIRFDKISANTYKSRNILNFIPERNNSNRSLNKFLFDKDFFEDEQVKGYIKDFYDILDSNVDRSELDDRNYSLNLSDEDIIKMDNTTFKIESYINNKINSLPDGKQKLLDNILSFFDNKKEKILSSISKQESNPTKYNPKVDGYEHFDAITHLLSIVSVDPKVMNTYLLGKTSDGSSEFEKSPYAPLQSQENAIRYAVSLVQSANDDFNIIREFYNYIDSNLYDLSKKQQNLTNAYQYVMPNAATLNGYPGAGKTTISGTIDRILEGTNKKISAYAPYDKQGKVLIDALGNRDNIVNKGEGKSNNISSFTASIIGKETYQKLINAMNNRTWHTFDLNSENTLPKNGDSPLVLIKGKGVNDYIFKLNEMDNNISKAFENIKPLEEDVVIIDEYTHLNPVDLAILEKFQKVYNANSGKQISYIFSGDTLQKGFTMDLEGNGNKIAVSTLSTFNAPMLTDMIRAGYNNKIDNITQIQALLQSVIKGKASQEIKLIDSNKIKLSYFEDETEGLIGEKIVDQITVNDLMNLTKDGDIVGVVVDNLDSKVAKLIKSMPEIDQAKFDIRITSEVQGSEFKNVVVDVNEPEVTPNVPYSGRSALQSIYTYISRSKKGTLISRSSIANGLNINSVKNTDNSKAEFDKNAVDEYKALRTQVLNSFYDENVSKDIKPSTKKTVNEKGSDIIPQKWSDESLSDMYKSSSDPRMDSAKDLTGDKTNSVDEFGEDKMYMYPFHERKNYLITKDENGKDSVDYDISHPTDTIALMSINNSDDIEDIILQNGDDFKLYQQDSKTIKSALLSRMLYHPDSKLSDVLPEYIQEEYPDVNWDKYDLVIESKPIEEGRHDMDIDQSSVTKGEYKPEENENKLIHFLNARFKDSNGNDLFFTIAALPNINNDNVQKQTNVANFIREKLNKIFKTNDRGIEIQENVSDLVYRKVGDQDSTGIVKRLTSIKFAAYSKPLTLNEFKEQNQHLVMSDPMIITRDYDFLKNTGDEEQDKKLKSLKGKSVMFVSFDKTLKPSELEDEYRNQLLQIKNGERTDLSVNISFLTTKQIKFGEWLKQNNNLIKEFQTNKKFPDRLPIYENHYMASKMLTNIIINSNYFNWLIGKQEKGDKLKDYQISALNKFYKNSEGNNNDKFKGLAKGLVAQTLDRIHTLFPDMRILLNDYTNALNSKDENRIESAKNAITDNIVSTLSKSYNSSDLTKSPVADYLSDIDGKEETKTILSNINDAKRIKYIQIVRSLFYKRTDSDNELSVDGDFIATQMGNQLDQLVAHKGEFRDGMVYLHATIEKAGKKLPEVPYLVKASNSDTDFIINKEILPPNIYVNMKDMEHYDLSESDAKVQQITNANMAEIHGYAQEFSVFLNKMNLDYSKPINEIKKQIIDNLNSNALLLQNNTYLFNYRDDQKLNAIDFDNISIDDNGNLYTNIDGNKTTYPEEFRELKLEGNNIVAIKKDGSEIVFDKQGQIVKQRMPKDLTYSMENNKILTTFAGKIMSISDEENISDDIKKEMQIEASKYMNLPVNQFVDKLNDIFNNNGLGHRFRIIEQDGEFHLQETKLNTSTETGDEQNQEAKPIVSTEIIVPPVEPVLNRTNVLQLFRDSLAHILLTHEGGIEDHINNIYNQFNESTPTLQDNIDKIDLILQNKDFINSINELEIDDKMQLFNALNNLFSQLKC